MNELQRLIKEAEGLNANIPEDVLAQVPAVKEGAKITSYQEQYLTRKLRSAIELKKKEG